MEITIELNAKQSAEFQKARELWTAVGPGPITDQELAMQMTMDGIHAILEDEIWLENYRRQQAAAK